MEDVEMEQRRSNLFLLVTQLSIALDEANNILRLHNLDEVVRSDMDLICPADFFERLSVLFREANSRLRNSELEVVYIPAGVYYYESQIKENIPDDKFWKIWYLTKTEKSNGTLSVYEILCAYLLPKNIQHNDDELEKFRPACLDDITYIVKDDSGIKVIVWSDIKYSWSSVVNVCDVEWTRRPCQCPHFEKCNFLQSQDNSISEFWKPISIKKRR